MRSRTRGVTLIELLVTLTVLLIVMAWGLPNLQGVVKQTRITSAVNAVVGGLSQARSVAVTRGLPVTLCAADAEAPNECNAFQNWAHGMLLFTDANRDGAIGGTDERILYRFTDDMVGLAARANVGAFTYLPDGSTNAGILHFCDSEGKLPARGVVVLASGAHWVIKPTACGTGI